MKRVKGLNFVCVKYSWFKEVLVKGSTQLDIGAYKGFNTLELGRQEQTFVNRIAVSFCSEETGR